MDLFLAIVDADARVIGLTWARSVERARDQLEIALAERGYLNTEDIRICHLPRETMVLDLEDVDEIPE